MDNPHKDLPVQEQLDALNGILGQIVSHLLNPQTPMSDVQRESGLPVIDGIQNLQVRMCRIERLHLSDLKEVV